MHGPRHFQSNAEQELQHGDATISYGLLTRQPLTYADTHFRGTISSETILAIEDNNEIGKLAEVNLKDCDHRSKKNEKQFTL